MAKKPLQCDLTRTRAAIERYLAEFDANMRDRVDQQLAVIQFGPELDRVFGVTTEMKPVSTDVLNGIVHDLGRASVHQRAAIEAQLKELQDRQLVVREKILEDLASATTRQRQVDALGRVSRGFELIDLLVPRRIADEEIGD